MKIIKIIYLDIIIIIILIIIILNVNKIQIIKDFILKIEIEKRKTENFVKYCNGKDSININEKIKSPKVSIITPIYNRNIYITRFIKNIQSQNFQSIEIIFVEDHSLDESIKTIEEYQKKEKRITLIKNKKNRGTFISRNIGMLFSNGKYVISADVDDMINKNILLICYKIAEKNNYDIIRFNTYSGGDILFHRANKEYANKKITQPKLSTINFYLNNELKRTDYYIHNKFIKKDVLIEVLNILNKFYLNLYMTIMEDQILSYIILRTGKSFYFLKNIGYYYQKHSISISNNAFKTKKLMALFKFIYLKLIFIYSKNTKYEKDMANYLITTFNKGEESNHILFNNYYNYNFYFNIINMYINSKFITKNNKNLLLKLIN